MALKDLFTLFDDALESVFHTKAHDPSKDRAAMIKRLEKTRDKFLATEPAKGKKDFSIANNVVAFSPTTPAGHPLILNGKTTNFIPSERFGDVIDNLIKSVEAGELDKELKSEGTPTASKPKTTRKPGAGSSGGWSPERLAKFKATVAARNAAKQG